MTLRIAWFKAQSQQRRGRIRSLHQGKIVEVVINHGCVGSSWLARARRGILKASHLGRGKNSARVYMSLHAELAAKKDDVNARVVTDTNHDLKESFRELTELAR